MFSTQGPTLRELTVQALSSTERGYDLLAPKFDHTPFRTPRAIVDAVGAHLRPSAPFRAGLDLCCGTGAGTDLLRQLCSDRVVGVDFSAGMLKVARRTFAPDRHATPSGPVPAWVRADARALPFRAAFDLVTCYGAFGHFLVSERPGLFAQVYDALRPGGCFAFPIAAPPRVGSAAYWALCGFDAAMRLRNALWRPPFVMYYRTFCWSEVYQQLRRTGFEVGIDALGELGQRADGSAQYALVTASRAAPEAQRR